MKLTTFTKIIIALTFLVITNSYAEDNLVKEIKKLIESQKSLSEIDNESLEKLRVELTTSEDKSILDQALMNKIRELTSISNELNLCKALEERIVLLSMPIYLTKQFLT